MARKTQGTILAIERFVKRITRDADTAKSEFALKCSGLSSEPTVIASWPADKLPTSQPTLWSEEVDAAAQAHCDGVGETTQYELVFQTLGTETTPGRPLQTQLLKRAPSDFAPGEMEATLPEALKLMMKHLEARERAADRKDQLIHDLCGVIAKTSSAERDMLAKERVAMLENERDNMRSLVALESEIQTRAGETEADREAKQRLIEKAFGLLEQAAPSLLQKLMAPPTPAATPRPKLVKDTSQ